MLEKKEIPLGMSLNLLTPKLLKLIVYTELADINAFLILSLPCKSTVGDELL